MSVKSAALAVAIFLASPYAWDYDMVVLTFAAAWLVPGRAKHRVSRLGETYHGAVLILPLGIGPIAKTCGLQLGPIVLWTALALLVHRALTLAPHRETAAREQAAAA